MTKKLILDYLRTNKSFLQEQFDVKTIGLFGSYAKELGAKVNLDLEKSIRKLIKEKISHEVLYA